MVGICERRRRPYAKSRRLHGFDRTVNLHRGVQRKGLLDFRVELDRDATRCSSALYELRCGLIENRLDATAMSERPRVRADRARITHASDTNELRVLVRPARRLSIEVSKV